MQFSREINRLLLTLLLAFLGVAAAAVYWAIVGPDTIAGREDNPRLVEAELELVRGDIFDRDGELLVTSERGSDGMPQRRYLHPAMHSALGYASLRYGVGGVEAAYNATLRGDDQARDFTRELGDRVLHRPQRGASIRLTLDLDIQAQAVEAMSEQVGAIVVLGVPDGDVLALVSLPTYDPNTLDAQWETLIDAPGQPFFNRPLQANYQPGSALQTPLMSAGLLMDTPLDTLLEDASAPVTINGLTLNCAVRLPLMPLTLRDAYAFACPAPFAALVSEIGLNNTQAALDAFHVFDTTPLLPGFIAAPPPNTPATPVPSPTPAELTAETLVENALGQGDLTLTPMSVAMMAAAIVNDGNAPQPFTLLGTRQPDEGSWADASAPRPTIPFATVSTARRLQDLMRAAVANGAAQNAGRPNIDIGGHASIAFSGEGAKTWFVGFATLGGRRGVAAVVVLENSDDPGLAADIGGTVLAAAGAALQEAG